MGDRLVAIIPARMGSSRFPGKPLAQLLGRPMIEHVLRRAEMCTQLKAVYVATCDEEIRRVVEGLGCRMIMTSPTHERASDRVAEAADQVEADVVVMIQGDEPMITSAMIAVSIARLPGRYMRKKVAGWITCLLMAGSRIAFRCQGTCRRSLTLESFSAKT